MDGGVDGIGHGSAGARVAVEGGDQAHVEGKISLFDRSPEIGRDGQAKPIAIIALSGAHTLDTILPGYHHRACLRMDDPHFGRALLKIQSGFKLEFFSGIASRRDFDRNHRRAFEPTVFLSLIWPAYANVGD